MYCSNCGHQLAEDVKFCSNCGAPVNYGASGSSTDAGARPGDEDRDWGGYSAAPTSQHPEQSFTPPPSPTSNQPFSGDESFADRKPDWEIERERLRSEADDEWAMTNLGPPKPTRRRTWLWVLLGIIGLMILACCVFAGWIAFTDSGTEWAENVISTSEAMATEAAATPVP